MIRKAFCILFYCTLTAFIFPAQANGQLIRYMRSFSFSPLGAPGEEIQDMLELPDGDLILVGSSSNCAGFDCGTFAAVMRTTAEGQPIWVRRFGHDSTTCYPWSVALGNDNSILVSSQFDDQLLVSKISLSGNVIWHREITIGGWFKRSFIMAAHDGYYVSAIAQPWSDYVGVLARIEANGAVSWMRTFRYPNNIGPGFEHIFLLGNGNLLVNGTGYETVGASQEKYGNPVLEFDPSGNLVQGKDYTDTGAVHRNGLYEVARTADQGMLRMEIGTGPLAFLSRTDASGNVIWVKTIDKGANSLGHFHVLEDQFGNIFLVTMYSDYQLSGPDRYFLYLSRLDPQGNLIDEKIMDFPMIEYINRLFLPAGCGVYVAGQITGSGPDYWAIGRMDSSGNVGNAVPVSLISVRPFELTDRPTTVSEVFIPYSANAPSLITDAQMPLKDTILLSSAMATCNLVGTNEPLAPETWVIGPNPCHDELNIFPASDSKGATATLCDLTGKTLIKVDLNNTRVKVRMTEMAAGTYLLRIDGGRGSLTRKIIKN